MDATRLTRGLNWTAGKITVTEEAMGPAGVQAGATHRMNVSTSLPEPGVLEGFFVASNTVEVSGWRSNWSLPPDAEGESTGIYARAGPVDQGWFPFWTGQLTTKPGWASIGLERETSGKQGPGLVGDAEVPLSPEIEFARWGWVDDNLFGTYGWKAEEFVRSPGLDDARESDGPWDVASHFCIEAGCFDPSPDRSFRWSPTR